MRVRKVSLPNLDVTLPYEYRQWDGPDLPENSVDSGTWICEFLGTPNKIQQDQEIISSYIRGSLGVPNEAPQPPYFLPADLAVRQYKIPCPLPGHQLTQIEAASGTWILYVANEGYNRSIGGSSAVIHVYGGRESHVLNAEKLIMEACGDISLMASYSRTIVRVRQPYDVAEDSEKRALRRREQEARQAKGERVEEEDPRYVSCPIDYEEICEIERQSDTRIGFFKMEMFDNERHRHGFVEFVGKSTEDIVNARNLFDHAIIKKYYLKPLPLSECPNPYDRFLPVPPSMPADIYMAVADIPVLIGKACLESSSTGIKRTENFHNIWLEVSRNGMMHGNFRKYGTFKKETPPPQCLRLYVLGGEEVITNALRAINRDLIPYAMLEENVDVDGDLSRQRYHIKK